MIYIVALGVRAAFERISRDFPTLYCVEATAVLAQALRKAGYDAVRMGGQFRVDWPIANEPDDSAEGESLTYAHAWVQVGETVIDIATDRFNSYLDTPMPRVYVGVGGERYIEGQQESAPDIFQFPRCQAALCELPGVFPEVLEPGRGALCPSDFRWFAQRVERYRSRLRQRVREFGEAVADILQDRGYRLQYNEVGTIQAEDDHAYFTVSPPFPGTEYRKHPHITVDITQHGPVIHLNLELKNNAERFEQLIQTQPDEVLRVIRSCGDAYHVEVWDRVERRPRLWYLKRPSRCHMADLSPERLRQIASRPIKTTAGDRAWLRAYFVSQAMPAGEAVCLGTSLAEEVVARIEPLLPAMEFFEWGRRP